MNRYVRVLFIPARKVLKQPLPPDRGAAIVPLMAALIRSAALLGRQLVLLRTKAAHVSRCPPSSTVVFSVEIILL